MPDVGPKRLAIWRRLAAICAQPGGSGPGLVADSADQFTEEGSQVLHKHVGASMAAKWPPSMWSDQYGTLWSGVHQPAQDRIRVEHRPARRHV
jgi:hypothetical protein